MKKLLPIVIGVCLAGLLFTSAYAHSGAATPLEAAAKPTQHPGQGKGQSQGQGWHGPCSQPGQSEADGGRIHYNGVLSAIGAASITISTTLSGTVTVSVVETTCIQMPPRKGLSLADLAVGMRVGVLAMPGTGANPVAVRIQAQKPRKVTYVGTVTAYAPGVSLSLQPEAGGSPLTFALTAGTEIKPWHHARGLAVGSQVTLQSVRDYVGPNPPALRIVVHGPGGQDD
jgi:hypothetical protein